MNPPRQRRVVVTGLGIVSPVGIGVAASWAAITAGKSGVAKITRFDATPYPTHFAAEVKGFDATQFISAKEARRYGEFIHYAMAAAKEAIADSGISATVQDAERIGVNIGSGIGGLPGIEETAYAVKEAGPRKISPFFIPGAIVNMAAGMVSITYGFKGPNLGCVSACSTANHSIGDAMRMIEYGDADVMVAGGTESTICGLAIGGFNAARALSTRNDSPETASRPWDVGRDGFVLGEGAGVIVVEELEHAKKRGAKIYCELVGYGMSSDAHHITAPLEDGDGARRCVLNAMKNGRVNADEVDYINAHGTSTPLGDVAEAGALVRALGDHAQKVAVSSTKSMTGHLLGAAAGVEAVFSIMAIHTNTAPPTINLHEKDPAVTLDLVPNTARSMKIDVAMSNSFGFGGTNSTLIFKRF